MKTLGLFFDALLAAIVAATAVTLADYLTKQTQLPKVFIVLSAGSVAALCYILLHGALVLMRRRITLFRRLTDRRAQFEGIWISRVPNQNERPYGYSTVDYNPETDAYSYRGAAFDTDGTMRSSWVSPKIEINLTEGEINFVTESQRVDDTGEFSRAFGHVKFKKANVSIGTKYSHGSGFFIDFGTLGRKANFLVDRLSANDVHNLISKREVVSNRDMSELIRALHKQSECDGAKAKDTSQLPLI